MMTCACCGKKTEWVLLPQMRRPNDPEARPFACCHDCAFGRNGRFRRRNATMWSPAIRARHGLAPIEGEPA